MRRWMLAGILVGMLLLAVPSVQAGGWAIVRLDALPQRVVAGEQFTVGFTVLQHGHTPTSDVQPYVLATNSAHSIRRQFMAQQSGAEGHFVVQLALPEAGTWHWHVVPAPFPAMNPEAEMLLEVVAVPAVALAPLAAPLGLGQPLRVGLSVSLLLGALAETWLWWRRQRQAQGGAA